MKWIEPKYSKKQVAKAGSNLLHSELNSDDFRGAVLILHNWRSSHAFPMQIMLDLLRKNAIRIDRNAVAVQRLKRVESIFGKLYREKGMSLSRMEDIGGCRVVVNRIAHVNLISEALKKSRTKHILHRERDYIKSPKESGYRGVHLVFRYTGGKEIFNGMSVELQIRSKVQHSWATTVEVVGTYTKQALKAGFGDAKWLEFFRYVSAEFAKLEGCPVEESLQEVDTFEQVKSLAEELHLRDRLNAFKVATKALTQDNEKGAGYFILRLDMEARVVNYSRFGKSQLEAATSFYDQQEQNHKEDSNIDVVMVSASSVRDLKRAYPNYFADTEEFEKNLMRVYEANK